MGQLLALLQAMQPMASHGPEMPEMAVAHEDMGAFDQWYAKQRRTHDLNPDPDGQFYDYRAAFRAGAEPDASGHWPSQFKQEGHPNMVVGGFHVQTGRRVPGAPLAKSLQELIDLGWEPSTAAELWARR